MNIVETIKINAKPLAIEGATGYTVAYLLGASNPAFGAAFILTAYIADAVGSNLIRKVGMKVPASKIIQKGMINLQDLIRYGKKITPFAVAYLLGTPLTALSLAVGSVLILTRQMVPTLWEEAKKFQAGRT